MSDVVRLDRYRISVKGRSIRADEDQERRIRDMDEATLARFLRVMGETDE